VHGANSYQILMLMVQKSRQLPRDIWCSLEKQQNNLCKAWYGRFQRGYCTGLWRTIIL